MTPLQQNLWKKMIQTIEDHEQNHLTFREMIDELKRLMDQANLQDLLIAEYWYGFWDVLSQFEIDFFDEPHVDYKAIRPTIEAMRSFLIEYLNTSATIHDRSSQRSAS